MIVDDKIMKYVVFKRRTENEVRQKCKLLKYDENMIDQIINYLKENEYLNDESYVEKYIQNVMRLKCCSINEIKIDLLKRGIDDDLIEKNINDELQEYETDSARMLAHKKNKTMDIEKIKKYLINKGFSYSNIAKAIDNLQDMVDN